MKPARERGYMRTYGQFCPIARTAEVLGERWTIIIVRNLLVGCRTFNEIAAGAPGLSPALLTKRLRELERAGVIEIVPKPAGRGSTYELTDAGREMWDVMQSLQAWGAKWAQLKPEHAHPGVILWTWINGYLRRDRLPHRRVLIRFDFAIRGPGRRCWVLVERGDAEICEKNPGFDEDVIVTVDDPVAFARLHLREIEWDDVLRAGAIRVAGPKELTGAIPTWMDVVGPFDRAS